MFMISEALTIGFHRVRLIGCNNIPLVILNFSDISVNSKTDNFPRVLQYNNIILVHVDLRILGRKNFTCVRVSFYTIIENIPSGLLYRARGPSALRQSYCSVKY